MNKSDVIHLVNEEDGDKGNKEEHILAPSKEEVIKIIKEMKNSKSTSSLGVTLEDE